MKLLSQLCGFVGLLLIAVPLYAGTIHVAPDGNDARTGGPQDPFATLQRARDAVRKLKSAGPIGEPISVLLHGGTYDISRSLELGPQDSGRADFPIIWQAAPHEEVHLTGGPALSASAFNPVTDEKVLARIAPNARGKIVQLNLRDVGEIPMEAYPESFRGVPAVPELFFNDKRMTVARWPNQGWATIAKFVDTGSILRDGDKTNRPGIFEYSGDEPARWNLEAGVWLQGYWCYDWYDEAIKIKSIDRGRKQITLAAPSLYGVQQGNPSPRRFRALNVLEELDQPGEFYIDPLAKVLYFWPPSPIAGSRIVLSTLNGPLLRMKDTEHVIFRGITFEASLGDGIEVSGGHAVTIDDCKVRNVRQLGIRVTGGTAHRVENCDITDTGTGGLILQGGDRKSLTPADHQANNNHIWNFSRHQLTGAYAIVLGGVGNRAAHNSIHDAPHQAIFLGGNDHIFEFNSISKVVTETDDAGALYKGRDPSCRGNIIRYNLWSDIGNPMGHGTAAIYFDDGDGGDLVFGNIFVRCGTPGVGSFGTIFSHGGHDIRAENNIFIDCRRALGSAPWDDARWKDAINGGQECHWQTKLLQDVDITKPPYTTRYPELVGLMNPQPGQPRNSHAKNNVLFHCEQVSSGNWKFSDSDLWVTDKDPGFINRAAGDFRLQPDAEVFKHLPAFKPIPFEQIGPQKPDVRPSTSPAPN
jgi:hypothetical protein